MTTPTDTTVTADTTATGLAVLRLADPKKSQTWIRRRVERLDLVDDRTFRRTIELYIDLRHENTLPTDDGLVFLPLLRLGRDAHAVISVKSPTSIELSRTTKKAERQLVTDALLATWVPLIKGDREKFTRTTRDAISTQITSPAKARVRAWLDPSQATPRSLIADAVLASGLTGALRRKLANDLFNWQRTYLLIAEIDPKALQLSRPLVVQLCYIEAIPRADSMIPLTPRGLYSLSRKLLAGSMSSSVQVPMYGVGDAESFHVSVFGPPGFRVVEACVRVEINHRGKNLGVWYRDDDKLPGAGHVYVPADLYPIRNASLYFSLYANKTGFFSECLASAIGVTAILGAFYKYLEHNSFDVAAIVHAHKFDPNFAAALVLLLPALLATFITQRDDHRIASKAFGPPRLLLAVLAMCSFAGALTFALEPGRQVMSDIWHATMITALIAAVRIYLGAIVHIYRLTSLRTRLRGWIALVKDSNTSRILRENGYYEYEAQATGAQTSP